MDDFRIAILAAVSHDVRTPLAAIKAGVSSLRQSDVAWTEEEHAELLATIEESTDRLDALLSNLLDLSRLQAGVLSPHRTRLPSRTSWREPWRRSLQSRVSIAIADDVPAVVADGGLLERVVANVVENAVRHSPPDVAVRISACVVERHRPASGQRQWPRGQRRRQGANLRAFQRLGDTSATEGIGLGLAVARGFAEALGGRLEPEDTAGGGLTMLLTLPAAEARAPVTTDLTHEVPRDR